MDTSGVVLTSVANGHFSTSNDAKRRVEGHHKGYFLSEKAKESEADGSESEPALSGHSCSLAETAAAQLEACWYMRAQTLCLLCV